MPPNAWNCACSVRPTDKDVTPVPGEEFVPPVFQNNPGKTAEFVNIKEHSYVKGVCPYFDTCLRRTTPRTTAPSGLADKQNPPVIPECEICEIAKTYTKLLSKLKRYEGVDFKKKRFKSGGVLELPVNASQNKQEQKGNIAALTILAKEYRRKYRLLPVIEDGKKNPDAINLDTAVLSDIKTPKTNIGKNAIQNSIKEAVRQKIIEEAIIHCQYDYSYKDIWEGLKAAFQKGRAKKIKTVIIIYPDGRIKEYDTDKIRSIIK